MPYIDRDAFIKFQRELYCKNCSRRLGVKNGKLKEIYKIGEAACKAFELNDALDDLDDYPEADVAPVVHAHWIDSPNIMECVVCSNCFSDDLSAQVVAPPPADYKFCPSCGAKMDEEMEEEK